jgi:hypothetical protein
MKYPQKIKKWSKNEAAIRHPEAVIRHPVAGWGDKGLAIPVFARMSYSVELP